jgi:TonB family protein
MKLTTMTALPLAALLCTTLLPAATSAAQQDIVVTASPREAALIDWSKRVEQNLQDRMHYPRTLGRGSNVEGLVDVRFVCTENGTPDKIAIARSSGNSRIDQAALRAVSGLTTLHPTVDGMKPDQAVRAQMLFTTAYDPGSTRALDQRIAELRKEAEARNKWFTSNEIASNEIVLTVGAK